MGSKRNRLAKSYGENDELPISSSTPATIPPTIVPLPSPTSLRSDRNWISFLSDCLSIDNSAGSHLPSAAQRRDYPIFKMDDNKKSRIVKFNCDAIVSMCTGICPKDPDALLSLCISRLSCDVTASEDKKLRRHMIAVTNALPKLSLQKRVLLVSLCTAYKHDVLLSDEFKLCKQTITTARIFLNWLMSGQELKLPVIRQQRYLNGQFNLFWMILTYNAYLGARRGYSWVVKRLISQSL